ncbi:MAG: hypothetical protein ABL958_01860 [Bdellovibrionia bacterium]
MNTQNDNKERLKHWSSILARMHKGLMDFQMQEREQRTGQVLTPGTKLQLLLSDPEFNWLRVLSLLMVKVDDLIFQKEPISEPLVAAARADIRALLIERANEDFNREYDAIKKFVPDVMREVETLKNSLDGSPGLLH